MSVAATILAHALSLSIPSTDGGRGGAASYERYLPERELSLTIEGELRESAEGDYTGVRTGIGARVRYYWRADRGAWLSNQPAGSMAGWFVGAGINVATDFTHDDLMHRWLGTTLQVGASAQIGYRIMPWRDLAITPSAGIAVHRDISALPDWTRPGIAIGLDVGWLF